MQACVQLLIYFKEIGEQIQSSQLGVALLRRDSVDKPVLITNVQFLALRKGSAFRHFEFLQYGYIDFLHFLLCLLEFQTISN